jgi:hypothetical protein
MTYLVIGGLVWLVCSLLLTWGLCRWFQYLRRLES